MKNLKYLLIILLFCLPYGFLSVYIELYASGIWEVAGYFMVFAVPYMLASQAAETNNKYVIIIGNMMSWISSRFCVINYSTDKLRSFCTFLRPEDVVNIMTVFMLVASYAGWSVQKDKLAKKLQNK